MPLLPAQKSQLVQLRRMYLRVLAKVTARRRQLIQQLSVRPSPADLLPSCSALRK